MDYITMKANAKINLALDVVGKRDDGYHDLKMVMQTVGLHDTLFIKKTFTPQIKLISNIKWLPTDGRNLVYQAAEKLFQQYGPKNGVYIEISKNIPVCAGLAGGSADCAAALVGISKLFDFPVSMEALTAMGKAFGADVPYCLMKGTALAEGIGDQLTPLAPHPRIFVLLAKPAVNISTAKVFGAYDLNNPGKKPDIPGMLTYIRQGDIDGIAKGFCNVLESVTLKKHPVIGEIKNIMVENGALNALMSGSGPTVFGYFKNKAQAFAALRKLRYGLGVRQAYLTNIFNPWRELNNE